MENKLRIAALAMFPGVCAFTNRASACYDPSLGRWLQQDPIANPGYQLDISQMASGGRFLEPDGYVDGANLYQFVCSNPITGVDPMGTDRYITGGILNFHKGIAVDIWQKDCNGKWTVVGQKTFNFSASRSWKAIFGLIYGPGEVDPYNGLQLSNPYDTIQSTREQDQALLTACEQSVQAPPLYSVWFFNCRSWSEIMIWVGIKY